MLHFPLSLFLNFYTTRQKELGTYLSEIINVYLIVKCSEVFNAGVGKHCLGDIIPHLHHSIYGVDAGCFNDPGVKTVVCLGHGRLGPFVLDVSRLAVGSRASY